jgi:hypothetical protein
MKTVTHIHNAIRIVFNNDSVQYVPYSPPFQTDMEAIEESDVSWDDSDGIYSYSTLYVEWINDDYYED